MIQFVINSFASGKWWFMIKKLTKTDLLFTVTLFAGLLLHFLFTLVPHILGADEAFYVSIPFRLINGDSLIQSEWHLSQFSSVFSYLPVFIWNALKGSTEGIILFIRYVYLAIHTALAVVIYCFFRKYKNWAIAAAVMFYMQVPYKIYGISYNSMLAMFLLLFTLCLLSIYKKPSLKVYVFAGISYAACCICNPFLCLLFPVYIVSCCLWRYKDNFAKRITIYKNRIKQRNIEKSNKKQSEKHNIAENASEIEYAESFNCFFSKKAFFCSFSGVCLIAVISIIFFFCTGGTISSVLQNIGNLLQSSEYDIVSGTAFIKFTDMWESFNRLTLNMPYLIPLLFAVLLLDKKKMYNMHRVIYMILSIIVSLVIVIGIFYDINHNDCIFSLPFAVFASICYIMTENKNKKIFYCMWCPCVVVAIISLFTANTVFSSAGVILSIANVAGVIFIRDLFNEMSFIPHYNITATKKLLSSGRVIICIGVCFQLLVYVVAMQYQQLPTLNSVKASSGPFAGMLMSEEQSDSYEMYMSDLDVIKEQCNENDAVLIASSSTWMYLYLQQPIATYTAWYDREYQLESLIEYYKQNTDKMPEYIYIDEYYNTIDETLAHLSNIFVFETRTLRGGLFLIVNDYKF